MGLKIIGGEMAPTEQNWLENDLAANQNATFRIICVHPTAYDEGLPTTGDDFDGNIYQVLTPIALQYHVNVVFSGHIHDYEVDNFNGTLWMRLGIGGNTDWGMNNSGYVQMAVSANQLILRSISTRTDNNLIRMLCIRGEIIPHIKKITGLILFLIIFTGTYA